MIGDLFFVGMGVVCFFIGWGFYKLFGCRRKKKDETISNANKKFKEFTDALCRKVLKIKDELTVTEQDAQQDFYEKFISS